MTAICIVQARMGSSRLPGKVVADLGGRHCVLQLLLERVQAAPVDLVVVATTVARRDDVVADLSESLGVAVVRGPEADVLRRFALVLDTYPAEQVVRITGDCPLVDPSVVAKVLDDHARAGADFTSNTLIRSYPDGLDVEVVSAAALRAADAEAVDHVEREHVTPFVHRRPERFLLAASVGPRQLAHERWTLDTPEDLAWLREVVPRMSDPMLGWERIMELRPSRPTSAPALRPATASDLAIVGEPIDDPSNRVWILDDGADSPLWARVSVRSGIAWLNTAGDTDDSDRLDRLLASLLSILRQDLQVIELWTQGSRSTVFARHGFTAPNASLDLRWTPSREPLRGSYHR